MQWLWIFLGGGLGSLCRVALGQALLARLESGLPWGTFAVNLVGCFLIGIAAAWIEPRGSDHPAHPFLLAGFLGGFTTFSTFGLETIRLIEMARPTWALAYALGSVVLGLVAAAAGLLLARH